MCSGTIAVVMVKILSKFSDLASSLTAVTRKLAIGDIASMAVFNCCTFV